MSYGSITSNTFVLNSKRVVTDDVDRRVDRAEMLDGGINLGTAHVGGGVQDLALQVRHVHAVEVDDADLPDAGCRQVHRDRRTEAAGADHQHARVEQLALPGSADVRQDDVTRVPLDLVLVEHRRGCRHAIVSSSSSTSPSVMKKDRSSGLLAVRERQDHVARLRVEGQPAVRVGRVGLGVGVRVVDRPQLPSLLVHLVEHLQLLLAVQAVRDRARVGVPHGEDLDGTTVAVGRDDAATLVGELSEPLLHDLFEEDAVKLGHRLDVLLG